MMVWGKSANANGGLGREGRRRVIIGNGSAGDRPLFTVSVDPGDEPERKGGGGLDSQHGNLSARIRLSPAAMATQETAACSLRVGQAHKSSDCADGLCSSLLKSCQ